MLSNKRRQEHSPYVDWLPIKITYTPTGGGTKLRVRMRIGVGDVTYGGAEQHTYEPHSNIVIDSGGGWFLPERAYTSDDLRAEVGPNHCENEYYDYKDGSEQPINIPSDATINEVLIGIEGYDNNPTFFSTTLKFYDGNKFWETVVPFTVSEQTLWHDGTTRINTPAKANALKTRILCDFVGGGGCHPPQSMFLGIVDNKFAMIPVEEIKIGDKVLGFNEPAIANRLGTWATASVTNVTRHTGHWKVIRAYIKYPPSFVNATYQHSELKRLFDLIPNAETLCDVAWTDNHPVMTQRGLIPAGELQVGDLLGELFYSDGLHIGRLPIEAIETEEFNGNVWELKGTSTYLFGRYMLGHMTKDPF